MDTYVLAFSAVTSFGAFSLSVVALVLTWQKRLDDPRTMHIENDLADLADRFQSYVKRQASRASRDKGSDEIVPPAASHAAFSDDPNVDKRFRAKYASRQ